MGCGARSRTEPLPVLGSCQHHTALLPLPILRQAAETGHKFADYVHLGRLAPLMAFMTLAAAGDGVFASPAPDSGWLLAHAVHPIK